MEPIDVDNENVTTTTNEAKIVGPDANVSASDAANVPASKGRTRSWVWKHFKKEKGATSTTCPYCKTVMACGSAKSGTSGLIAHLQLHCETSPASLKKTVDMKKQSTLGFKPTGKGEGSSLATHSFSQEKCRRALARMCVKDNRPFSIVDDEGFKDYSWELNPLFKLPSRWTVARDCLKIYKEEAANLKKLLKNQRVSLTTDTWSSVQNINYMCLTAHWVDDYWILRKKILNFCPIANHKGETIGKLVYACLKKWDIDQIFTVTVDNASSNDGAIRYLKNMLKGPNAILACRYLHLRCCAHIINLIVKDGLEEQDDSIYRIRQAVKYVRSSPSRTAKFKECVEAVKNPCKKKPSLDVDTRWNSTYLMLETALKYIDVFDRLKLVEQDYLDYFQGADEVEIEGNTRKRRRKDRVTGPPEASDWETAKQFLEYLSVFYNVTNLISGSKFVTSNLFFAELVTMHGEIARMSLDVDPKKRKMACSMKEKYDKYWDNLDNMNLLLYVAVVLDPRCKTFFLGFTVGQIYGINAPKTKEICGRVMRTLNELFDDYKVRAENDNSKTKEAATSLKSGANSTFGATARGNLEANFLKYMEEQGGMVFKSELEIYLADELEKRDDKFDLLSWWKVNSLKYPVLSQVARHVLAMPISTVASESAFSTGGRVIDPFRSSLTPQTAEALICTQDWIRDTPTDIEIPDVVHCKAIAELQDKLENIEIDEFGRGPKFFDPSLVDEYSELD